MDSLSEYLLPGEALSQRQSREIINHNLVREVDVINVVDSLSFFVKLRDELHTYYALKESLPIFYGPGGQGSRHPLLLYKLRPSFYTVVNYNGIWIRFFILTVTFTTNTVVGMSIDFGKILTLNMTEHVFYPLHRLFAALPSQVIHCRLYNVIPVKGPLGMKGREILTNMTGIDRSLGAIFVQLALDRAETYDVVLFDSTNEEPFFIVEKMFVAGCITEESYGSHKNRRTTPKRI